MPMLSLKVGFIAMRVSSIEILHLVMRIVDSNGQPYLRTDRGICPELDMITSYIEHTNLFFTANNVPGEKQVAVFLSVIGGKTYMPCSAVC